MTNTEPICRSLANPAASLETPSKFAALRSLRRTLLLLTPWFAGCEQMNSALIQDRALIWLFLSLVGVGLVAGAGIWWRYGRLLDEWDLKSSVSAPDSSRERNILIGSVLVIVLTFALYNWFSDIGIPPEQQWENIVGWLVGSAAGGFAGYRGGRHLAAASYRKPIETGGDGHQGRLPGKER